MKKGTGSDKIMYKAVKRLLDIIFGIIGCIILLPLAIFVKIAYLIKGDHNSIFFVQKRIGINGEEFNFYKFRSMVPNADEILFKLLREDEAAAKEYKKYKKLKNDPRITGVGKFLRRSSLDELPQFINVLNGTMSLIGNRPYLPREKQDIGEAFDDIVKTKPGLTGYWQVSGKGNSTFEKRIEMETEYSNKANLLLDIKIFFQTFGAVLFGHGAE